MKFELTTQEALALSFAAMYGLFSATPADDSSNPMAVYARKALVLEGLRVGIPSTDVLRVAERLMGAARDAER